MTGADKHPGFTTSFHLAQKRSAQQREREVFQESVVAAAIAWYGGVTTENDIALANAVRDLMAFERAL